METDARTDPVREVPSDYFRLNLLAFYFRSIQMNQAGRAAGYSCKKYPLRSDNPDAAANSGCRDKTDLIQFNKSDRNPNSKR